MGFESSLEQSLASFYKTPAPPLLPAALGVVLSLRGWREGLGLVPQLRGHPGLSSCSYQINNTAVGHVLVLPARNDLSNFLKNVLTCHVCLGRVRWPGWGDVCPTAVTKCDLSRGALVGRL